MSTISKKDENKAILEEINLNIHWRDWCWSWSWSSHTWATGCEELTHWKRSWCWERLQAGGEGDDRGWDGWMASPTQWTWVWVNSGSRWWTRRPGMLLSRQSQRVRHDWVTELIPRLKENKNIRENKNQQIPSGIRCWNYETRILNQPS